MCTVLLPPGVNLIVVNKYITYRKAQGLLLYYLNHINWSYLRHVFISLTYARATRVTGRSITAWNGNYRPHWGKPATPPLPTSSHPSHQMTHHCGRLPKVSNDPRCRSHQSGILMPAGPRATTRRVRHLRLIFVRCSRRTRLPTLTILWSLTH